MCNTSITLENWEKTKNYNNGGPRGDAKEKGENTTRIVRGSMIPKRMRRGSAVRFSVGVAEAAICPTWQAQAQRVDVDD